VTEEQKVYYNPTNLFSCEKLRNSGKYKREKKICVDLHTFSNELLIFNKVFEKGTKLHQLSNNLLLRIQKLTLIWRDFNF